MPMTEQEAQKSIEVMLRHMSPRQARSFASDMWAEVGEQSENDSVRETIKSILELSDKQEIPDVPNQIYAAWVALFVVHWAFVIGNLSSAAMVALCAFTTWPIPNWSIAFPIVTFIAWSATSRIYDCPLTRIDDHLRSKHGLPPVKAFLKHYLVGPLRRAWRIP